MIFGPQKLVANLRNPIYPEKLVADKNLLLGANIIPVICLSEFCSSVYHIHCKFSPFVIWRGTFNGSLCTPLKNIKLERNTYVLTLILLNSLRRAIISDNLAFFIIYLLSK